MAKGAKRLLCVTASLLLIFTLPFSRAAGEAPSAGDTALTVVCGGSSVQFTKAELYDIAEDENNGKCRFSAYNSFPTYSIITEACGPSVRGILMAAQVEVAALSADATITFFAPDGFSTTFTADALFGERFFFPNGGGSIKGGFDTSSVYFSASEPCSPAIIWLDNEDGQLLFGQSAPNEITAVSFVKYLADGGTITVNDTKAAKYDAPTLFSDAMHLNSVQNLSSAAAVGTKLHFSKGTASRDARIYYTVSTNGTQPPDPTVYSLMYDTSDWSESKLNPYTVESDELVIIKAVVIGRDGLNSDVATWYINPPDSNLFTKIADFFKGIGAWFIMVCRAVMQLFGLQQ